MKTPKQIYVETMMGIIGAPGSPKKEDLEKEWDTIERKLEEAGYKIARRIRIRAW